MHRWIDIRRAPKAPHEYGERGGGGRLFPALLKRREKRTRFGPTVMVREQGEGERERVVAREFYLFTEEGNRAPVTKATRSQHAQLGLA